MKAGILVRADARGLGVLTGDAARMLPWERTAVIDYDPAVGDPRWPSRPELYPGADVWRWDPAGRTGTGELPEAQVRAWLDGLDVVYSAETVYDWRLIGWAHDAGVAVVVHGMPEYYRHRRLDLPQPDAWWWPTGWLLGSPLIPAGEVVPVPVSSGPVLAADPLDSGPLVVHHVAGVASKGDRNGTAVFVDALDRIRTNVRVRIFAQDQRDVIGRRRFGRHLDVEVVGPVDDRCELASGAHLTVMPRRYAGLCLPVQEALAAGVGAIVTGLPDNDWLRAVPIPVQRTSLMSLPVGPVPVAKMEPARIAHLIDDLNRDREALTAVQGRAIGWALDHSWRALAGRWADALTRVVSGSPTRDEDLHS